MVYSPWKSSVNGSVHTVFNFALSTKFPFDADVQSGLLLPGCLEVTLSGG
jgi:hypothetical protein